MDEMKRISVGVFYRRGETMEVWFQVRFEGNFQGLLEFPGGKIERGESPKEAVIREINEEVGYNVSEDTPVYLFNIYQHHYNGISLMLHVFLIDDQGFLGDKGEWIKFESIPSIENFKEKTLEANEQILKEIFEHFKTKGTHL